MMEHDRFLVSSVSFCSGLNLCALCVGALCPCMFSPVIQSRDKRAEGDLREWAIELVGGGRLRLEPGFVAEVEAGTAGKPSGPASPEGADGVRSIRVPRLDLVTEQKIPPSVLVKLEPLNEPKSSHCKMEKTKSHNTNVTYVGLDVSKAQLDYTVDGRCCRHVSNTPQGMPQLLVELESLHPPARVVVEATGGYERTAVAALLEAGLEVCIVNPGRVRAFAHAEGQLAKTDKIDAILLKRFGEKVHPRLHVRTEQACLQLRELLEYRRLISDQLVATSNRLELAGSVLRPLLESTVKHLEDTLAQADRAIAKHLKEVAPLREKAERMRQLKGVGPVLAATLLAYVPELGRIPDGSLAALVGVAPYARDSGKSHRPRHVRGGRAVVRHVLYMAAVCATRHNRILGAFYRRLRTAGKPACVALVAVMRKMLGVINRLIADPQFTLAQ